LGRERPLGRYWSGLVSKNHKWQQEATSILASGSVADAVSAYADQGCVHLDSDATVSMQRLVEDWFITRSANAADVLSEFLVVAHKNEDVDRLNGLIRAGRVERNEIAPGYLVSSTTQTLHLAIGDRLLFTKNDRRLGVKNGRFASVDSVNFSESGKIIDFTVRLDGSSKLVKVNPEKYKHFALGYAATVHKTQGMTVNHAFVYASGIWNRCLTYVAMTRHRLSCHLYAGDAADEQALARNLGRYGLKDSVLDFPLAFAERRGIDSDLLEKRLPEHIASRLQGVVERVVTRLRQVVMPKAYQADLVEKDRLQTEKEQRATKIAEIIQRRKDAPHVAAYCDASQDVGVTWGLLEAKLFSMGLDKMSYVPEDFDVISMSQEHQVFSAAVAQRNALAYGLLQSPLERYAVALDSNNVDLAKLAEHAEAHACFLRVEAYVLLCQGSDADARDAQAAVICRHDFLKHFSALKSAGVDAATLRLQAIASLRKERFLTLTPDEQKTYLDVERYRTLVAECGAYYAAHIKVTEGKDAPKEPNLEDLLHRDHLQALSAERDYLAEKIFRQPESHAAALHFYHIGSVESHFGEAINEDYLAKAVARATKLSVYAEQHLKGQEVACYQAYQQAGDKDLCESQAMIIARNIKGYYPQLKALSVDVAQLRKDALLGKRQVMLQFLSPEQQKTFLVVERYRELVTESGAYYVDYIQATADVKDAQSTAVGDVSAEVIIAREHALHWEALNKERDKLASIILRQQDIYGDAMHYHGIGSAQAHFGEVLGEKQVAHAKERLVKLKAHAIRHRLRDHILEYARETDATRRMALAFKIKQNIKGHFAAMMQLGLDNTQGRFWKSLSIDAKRHECLEFYKASDFTGRLAFKEVEAYSEAKRKHGQAWRELFDSKEGVSEAAFADLVKRYAEPYTSLRDSLAAKMLAQPYAYQKSMAFFDVKAEDLVKPAEAHNLREQVSAFANEIRVKVKAELAYRFTENTKGYAAFLKQQGISWKSVYDAARLVERQTLFAQISPAERRLLRGVDRYNVMNRQLGKTYGQLKANPDQKAFYQEKCDRLSGQRDALASKLMDVQGLLEMLGAFGEIQEAPKVRATFERGAFNWQKIAKQAEQHTRREQELGELAEDVKWSNNYLKGIVSQHHNKPSETVLNSLLDWSIARQDSGIDALVGKVALKKSSYRAVLNKEGLRFDSLAQQQAVSKTISHVLSQWLDLHEKPQTLREINPIQEAETKRRVDVARRIEQGSQAIEGTLAMRYLREHRGIDGLLPDSCRFHPGVYHFETKTKYPALVVIAKNQQEQTQAVQVIFLDKDTANKAPLKSPKLTYGLLSEGNIGVLMSAGVNNKTIAIAEGPETALSIATADPSLRVYAVLGSGNFARAPI
jgi:hypothetical protein